MGARRNVKLLFGFDPFVQASHAMTAAHGPGALQPPTSGNVHGLLTLGSARVIYEQWAHVTKRFQCIYECYLAHCFPHKVVAQILVGFLDTDVLGTFATVQLSDNHYRLVKTCGVANSPLWHGTTIFNVPYAVTSPRMVPSERSDNEVVIDGQSHYVVFGCD